MVIIGRESGGEERIVKVGKSFVFLLRREERKQDKDKRKEVHPDCLNLLLLLLACVGDVHVGGRGKV